MAALWPLDEHQRAILEMVIGLEAKAKEHQFRPGKSLRVAERALRSYVDLPRSSGALSLRYHETLQAIREGLDGQNIDGSRYLLRKSMATQSLLDYLEPSERLAIKTSAERLLDEFTRILPNHTNVPILADGTPTEYVTEPRTHFSASIGVDRRRHRRTQSVYPLPRTEYTPTTTMEVKRHRRSRSDPAIPQSSFFSARDKQGKQQRRRPNHLSSAGRDRPRQDPMRPVGADLMGKYYPTSHRRQRTVTDQHRSQRKSRRRTERPRRDADVVDLILRLTQWFCPDWQSPERQESSHR